MDKLYALFYKTVFQDEKTGMGEYLVTPTTPCSYAVDGLVRCYGQVGCRNKGMPICMQGHLKKDVFYVEDDFIPASKKEDVLRVLEYVAPELTETQMNAIASVSGDDLFSFVSQPGAKDLLNGVLKRSSKCQILSAKIIRKITALKEQEELTRLLLSLDISIDRIELLMRREVTLGQLKRNPYLPCLFADISIRQAEQLADRLLDVKPLNLARLVAYTYDALLMNSKNGNTCCTLEDLLRYINYLLAHSGKPVTINMALLNLCLQEIHGYAGIHIIDGIAYVYLNRIWEEENSVIEQVRRMGKSPTDMVREMDIKSIEEELNICYNAGQKNAFHLLETSGIKILTGPPGSGKTAVIRGLLKAYRDSGRKTVRLSATTGRAAQVMSDACGEPAETVNIMLNVRPYNNDLCGWNLNNPLDADLIIVDEISMIGLKLFSMLLQAVKSSAILLLVGDKDQLQSVDYGNVLHDLIRSETIEVYYLTEIMRQSGTIPENASLINSGIEMLKFDDTFRIFDCVDEQDLLEKLKIYYKPGISQVLSPVKKGMIGVWGLNRMLQPKGYGKCFIYGKQNYYIGDRVIMTQTNYDKGYFNGDIGVIEEIVDGIVTVLFPKKRIALSREDLYHMSLAYAITVHKAQGSECDEVHIVLPAKPKNMLTRRIFYTAITRARKKVYLYNLENAYIEAINNVRERERKSLLGKRLAMNTCQKQKK